MTDQVRIKAEPEFKRRRPWLAALLSIFLMGLGQLYAGRPGRAAVVLFVTSILNWVFQLGLLPAWKLLLPPSGFRIIALVLLACLAWILFSVVDAWICARKAAPGQLAPYQRWYVYLAIYLLIMSPMFLLDVDARKPIESYSIPSRAMTPSVLEGGYLLSINGWYSKDPPNRGEIAIFKHPDSDVDYIKRIIGLPGDRVQMRNGILYLNGTVVERRRIGDRQSSFGENYVIYEEQLPSGTTYLIAEISDAGPLDNTEEQAVPDGYVFVMGDNRDNSSDSRVFGFVPIANLTDRPILIYWSRDWSRIGLKLQ